MSMKARIVVSKVFPLLALIFPAWPVSAQLDHLDIANFFAPRPMFPVIVTSADPDCVAHCAQWIAAQGLITSDTPTEFERVFKEMGKRRLAIFIHSPGGDVKAALRIGRMIRKRRLNVLVTSTSFQGCSPDLGCAISKNFFGFFGNPVAYRSSCASACAYILAGGAYRSVGATSFVGVHQSAQPTLNVSKLHIEHKRDRIIYFRTISEGQPRAVTSAARYENIASYLEEIMHNSSSLQDLIEDACPGPELVQKRAMLRLARPN